MRRSAVAVAVLALSLAPSLLAETQFFPNSVKYRDTSLPNATGRAGSANVEARALVNRDGTATVDVSTDSGTLAKVQLDSPKGATLNFNDLDDASFTTTVNGIGRSARVGVQANVRGVDGARTDVVSLEETAKLRPDLYAGPITATNAILGSDTTIRALVGEANGDVGARADAQLFADDVLVDRASGIWVDAGGRVVVTFKQTFHHPVVQLRVVVANVDPADWDDANNAQSYELHLEDPPQEFYSWNARATEQDFSVTSYMKYEWGEFNRDDHGFNQMYDFSAVLRYELPQNELAATVKASTDGAPLYDGEQSDFRRINVWYGYCSVSYGNPEVEVCWNGVNTTIEMSAVDADAVYRSWGWATRRNPWAPEEPRFEWNRISETHTAKARFGSRVDMDVALRADGKTFAAQPSMEPTNTTTFRVDNPYHCYYSTFEGWDTCQENHQLWVSRWGTDRSF